MANGTLFTLDTDIGDLDLLGEVGGIGSYPDVRTMADLWTIYGYSVKVLSIDGRDKDTSGLKILYALKEAKQDDES